MRLPLLREPMRFLRVVFSVVTAALYWATLTIAYLRMA
jgi:hypothetical protein